MIGAIVLAVLQKLGLHDSLLFVVIGVANLVVAVIIARTLPTSWLNDLLSIIFRTLYRLEVTGLENVAKAVYLYPRAKKYLIDQGIDVATAERRMIDSARTTRVGEPADIAALVAFVVSAVICVLVSV